ncbi:MAG TPA: DinB family protein [Thermoanaerobaculia bacterium]
MKMTELFLAELDREADYTRRVLQEVPAHKTDFKPGEKSMPFGYLTSLTAMIVSWIDLIINQPELDIAPATPRQKQPDKETPEELIALLDESVAKARTALQNTTDEHLMTNWKMLAKGKVVSDQPRHIFIQDAVFNHLAHHRGQLTVYLRILGAKVPSTYGPSADEPIA